MTRVQTRLTVDIGSRYDHHHTVTRRRGRSHGPVEHPHPTDGFVLLRLTETRATAPGDHDGPHNLGLGEGHDAGG